MSKNSTEKTAVIRTAITVRGKDYKPGDLIAGMSENLFKKLLVMGAIAAAKKSEKNENDPA